MYSLISYRISKEKKCLEDFEKGAGFWNLYFIDHKYGGTYLNVYPSGEVKDSEKGNPYKTCYHSMEHSLLNYAYLNLWVNRQPVELHFSIRTNEKADTLYPSPVEGKDIEIIKAVIKNEGKNEQPEIAGQSVILPGPGDLKIKVFLK
jgi:hypothetical protein